MLLIIFQIKFYFLNSNRTALHAAIEKGNSKIVEILLNCKEVDVNIKSILIQFYLMSFQNQYKINFIQNFKVHRISNVIIFKFNFE